MNNVMSQKISIVIPTYNEKANIEKLLGQIFALGIPNVHVLVVDDSSPDGTGQLVDQLCQRYANLSILHRVSKEGLGRAYVAGFKEVLSAGADFIFEMDADLSHDPSHIPQFLTAIQAADVVLGSRYIAGGGVKNWNIARRLISYFGNRYARFILSLPYHDLTGGFKCFRRQALEQLNLDSLNSLGYNFQIETTYAAHRAGFRIKEVPIVFTERVEGKSKFNFKIMLEGFWRVLALRLRITP